MRIIKLISLLIILIHSNGLAETTNNLVSQDFTTGWSGTNLSSTHGSGTVAGVDGQYILSDSVSLNDNGINKESLNEGFTVTGSSNIYFWSGPSQSVTQTIKAVDDNGNIVTQTRILSGTSGSGWLSTLDQMIIGQNSQQDYNVSLRYDFSVPGYPTYHYGADLNIPSLTVSYTYVPPMDAATQTALLDLNKTITDDLKDVKEVEIKEEVKLDTGIKDEVEAPSTSTDTMQSPTAVTDTKESPDTSASTTSDSQESSPQETASSDDTNSQESQKSDQASAETSDDKQESTSESNSSQDVADKEDKSKDDSKSVSLSTNISNIDVKVKDIGKNMELKNIAMLEKMVDNSLLNTYANIPFYKFKAIYEDQADIRDNRILYPNTSLVSYMEKDPVFIKQNLLYNIKKEKEKLLRELSVLKNG